MKKLIANLKSQGFKQMAIDHAEKAVCGVIGFVVLLLLIGANWSTYERQPDEFEQQIKSGRETLAASTWPEDEKQNYLALPNIDEMVEVKAFAPLQSERYEPPTEVRMPLKPKVELKKEPELFAVTNLRAKADDMIMLVDPLAEETEDWTDPDAPSSEDETEDSKTPLDIKFGDGRPRPTPGTSESEFSDPLADTEMYGTPPEGYPGEMDEEMLDDGYYGENTGGAGTDGRGYRYVAVTGIVPVRDQAKEFMNKLNIRRLSEARRQLIYSDFVVERQTAARGDDRWSGPWEKVDLAATVDVWKQAAGHEQDIVPENVRNSVFTAPLPMRFGNWLPDIVSHPMIKTLTEKQREEERLLNEKAMEAYREKFGEPDQPRTFRGYQELVVDINEIREQVLGSEEGEEVISNVADEMRTMERQYAGEGMGYGESDEALFQARISQESHFLLFRFLDFDVEPGKTYRYRVKLVLANPTYQAPLDLVSHEGMTLEREIQTPWSEATSPVSVPQDQKFFLSSVKKRRLTEETTAAFNLFYWLPDAGTTVNVALETSPGQFIGRPTDAEVIRPGRNTFEREEDVPLTTDDMLVDVAAAPVILQSDHLDLDFQRASGVSRARGSSGIGAPDRALVIDKNGELVVKDTARDATSHRKAFNSYKEFAEYFSYLKQSPVETEEGDDLESFMEEYDEGMMMGPDAGRIESVTRRRGRGRSRRSRSQSRGAGVDSYAPDC